MSAPDGPRWSDHGAWAERPDLAAAIRRRVRLRWFTGFVAVVAVAAFLVSNGRVTSKCRNDCYGEPPLSRYGSATYEPGHPWTSYADSWQWGAQHALAVVGLLAALVALGLSATSDRRPGPALGVTAVVLGAWLAWVLLSPPVG